MSLRLSSLPQPACWGILALAGASNTLGFAPYNYWLVTLLSPVFLFLLLPHASRSQALRYGWSYGLGWFGAGISWVHISIAEFGGLPITGSLVLISLLVMYLALFPALFSYVMVRWIPKYLWLALGPILWYASEWLRGTLMTGFPWLSLGYSQLHSPLHYLAPIIGETGLSYLVILCAIALSHLVQQQKQILTVGVLFSVIASSFAASFYLPITRDETPIAVALVQGNIKQELRWVEENEASTMQRYKELTTPLTHAELIIWPEAAIPRLEAMSQPFLIRMDESLAENQQALVSGIIDYQPNSREIYNSLIVLGSTDNTTQPSYYYQHPNRYQKNHLLPIGEVVPFETILRPIAPIFDLPMSSFNRGAYTQPALKAAGLFLTPVICFEIAFAEQVLANLGPQTDFIITVSNDAWFGDSIGPLQHMQIAQMRALEVGRPVLRATNNGLTGVTDEYGNLTATIPQFVQGVLEAQVYPTHGTTFYAQFGEQPKYLIFVLLIALCVWVTRRC